MSGLRYRIANTLIVLVLGLQAATFYFDVVLWPFVDYPMYNQSFGPEVTARFTHLKATLADGRTVDVTPELLKISQYSLGWNYEKPLLDWDQPWVAAELAGRVQNASGQPVVSLFAELKQYEITDNGLVDWDEVVVFDLDAQEPSDER